jgi:hypothetical protein
VARERGRKETYVGLSGLWFHQLAETGEENVLEVTISITSSLDLDVFQQTKVFHLMFHTSSPTSHWQLLVVRFEATDIVRCTSGESLDEMTCRGSNLQTRGGGSSLVVTHIFREKTVDVLIHRGLHTTNKRSKQVVVVLEAKLFHVVFYVTSVMLDGEL